MKKTLPFKLEINDTIINEFEISEKNVFIFDINNQLFSLKKLCSTFELLIICNDCNSKTIIKNIQPHIKLNKPYLCRICRNSGERNGMYGKQHTISARKKMGDKQSGENNHFYGKKHSYESILKQRKAKIGLYNGSKNPMYNKSFFDIWVEKYGIDVALVKLAKKSEKQRKNMLGSNNPMYRKNIYDIWVEKYGGTKAKELHDCWLDNLKNSLTRLYDDNDFLKNKISESLKGRVFSDEHKLKLRLSSIEYIKKKLDLNGGKIVPNFNIYACQLLDEISKITNTNIQHALNGGEYYISKLGYWVDGYDHENNIVYEYYEREHKKRIDKDNEREFLIKDYLKCEFKIIYEGKENEFLNILI
jgi:hypothetical protein